MKVNYGRKSTMSVKRFILEYGEGFSEHIKKRLMDLEERCFFTTKGSNYLFDLKHVEHLKFHCCNNKEYCYAQFAVINEIFYLSEACFEDDKIIQSPKVRVIYEELDHEGLTSYEDRNLKIVDDSNIDFVVDSILSSCPPVSKEYLAIVKSMVSHANSK